LAAVPRERHATRLETFVDAALGLVMPLMGRRWNRHIARAEAEAATEEWVNVPCFPASVFFTKSSLTAVGARIGPNSSNVTR